MTEEEYEDATYCIELEAAREAMESSASPTCSTPIGYVLTADDWTIREFAWSTDSCELARLERGRRHLEETGSTDVEIFPVFRR